ncbi:MAG: hypothetical protein OXU20_26845 [Myxococcales bacterium]|nr:hypothetical protein [Myxococcales bacterium]
MKLSPRAIRARAYFLDKFGEPPPLVVTELPGVLVDDTDIRTIAEFIEGLPTVKQGHKVKVQVGTPVWG